jgi:hypothetical protein
MNAVTPFASPRPVISDAERARRVEAVNFGRGSVRYEGGILTDEIELINARFVSGELTSEEFVEAVKASATVRLG